MGVATRRQFLCATHGAEIAPVTRWRTLQRWGLTSGTGQRRAALQEHAYVVLARRRYLRQKRANRHPDGSRKRPEVSLDETFVHKNHAGQFPWSLAEEGPWVNTPSGTGPRLLIVPAMTGAGGVQGAAVVFASTQRTGEYHGHMHWENVSPWFSEPLLPHLPSHALLLFENAPSHNVVGEEAFPTPQSRKDQRCLG